jgi:hypothetical protein
MVKKHTSLTLLLIIICLGFVIRLSYFIGNNFPLHDGGLFYVMIQDLLSNNFILPDYSSYNNANIPYIYPPFGFYFVGILESLTGISRLQLFRIIPLLVTTLTIPAFYFLAIEINKNRWTALTATTVFSLLPTAYKWLILGGGVTRSFGALFGILALVFVLRLIESGGWKAVLMGSIFCGLTVLSHPEWAWFLFYSIGIFVFLKLFEKQRMVLLRSFLIFLLTSIIILPWLLTIIYKHGHTLLQPFLDSGFSRWGDIIKLFLFEWSGEILFPIFTFFSLVGIFRLFKKKEWFVIFWLPLIFFLQGRAASQRVVIPLALLAGVGIITTIFILLNSRHIKTLSPQKISILFLGIFLYSLIGGLVTATDLIKPLHEEHIDSFEWIEKNSPAGSRILVISGKDWIHDNYSEWMVALTGRKSVSVVQGYEWLPGFSERISQYNNIQIEYSKGMVNLVSWINQNDAQADFLIITKEDKLDKSNWAYAHSLYRIDALLFPGVDKVFENERVLILDLRTVINHEPKK